MSEPFHSFEAKGIEVTVDLRVGHIRQLAVTVAGRRLEPLHTAPWADDPSMAQDIDVAPNVRFLSGDFFCAPFGLSDLQQDLPERRAYSHGATANAPWSLVDFKADADGKIARYALQEQVLGARVLKELRVRDGHPFLYERHIFQGGDGAVPVANHAMTRIDGEGRIFLSRKAYGWTQDSPLETDPHRGRSALAYPARFDDLTQTPMTNGGKADLTRYPFAEHHEDFVILVEAPGSRLGWMAVAREPQRDLFLSLKNPADYPFTFLWISNGGRDYKPWSGRHRGVLGVEEARAFGGYGYRASIADNPFTRAGLPTALSLTPHGEAQVRNIIGGLPLPDGWTTIASISASADALTLTDGQGRRVLHSFDGRFLEDRDGQGR